MKRAILALFLACAPLATSAPAAAASTTRASAERAAILTVIARMEAAWNRGDFKGYMWGFENPGVVFISGGKFQSGWQGTLDHYVRDYGGDAGRRGKLHFYDMKVDLLAPDAAMLVGRYRLERTGRVTEGINTRLFRKRRGQWRISMNHVSAYDLPSAPAAR
jgi:ketosteroid isomerase-like protein